ncbi:DHA2 family efflux MFS transporter permease subunit [Parafrankia sp. EUN1f]|uniref:DHA2 family efflux MFS transporter permease subunit n=1 Tax=Parafrankia sp. EUN1f TaxID=102897 RepID=UPI0001C45E8E|nr:DHA2 family efflux MFS transporter permease subunit [Parafrankia sp. EUN1f]EFC82726.1 drug resistance transporter, EmrB/QacA subfamily [Parafrankia sp. EUN1f]
MAAAGSPEQAGLRMSTARGRWVLLATVLGSGIASIDATAVSVALPSIGRDLGADLASLQWVITAYTVTLAGFLLVGGSLGDRYGRRRVFMIGVGWFAVASLLCGIAPNVPVLVAARALQGVGGALLAPGSLAILQASFAVGDRPRAIGAWSGLSGVATAVGPFLGGWLVEVLSWRLVFFINLPLVAAVLVVAARHVPESTDPGATGRVDLAGAVLVTGGLVGLSYGLIEGPDSGWDAPAVLGALLLGVASLAGFVAVERRAATPMMPLDLFGSRQFSAANMVTFVVYASLGGALFLLPIQLQQVGGYSPLAAGTALLPLTIVMLTLSARSGALAERIGPRAQMTVGPVVAAAGLALITRAAGEGGYLLDVLPGVIVLGLGLATVVAPLTSTALGAAPAEHAGIASAVNNDVARTAQLLAVAVLPAAAGLTGDAYLDAAGFASGFQSALWIVAGLCASGGLVAYLGIRNPAPTRPTAIPKRPMVPCRHCGIDAPPPVTGTAARR